MTFKDKIAIVTGGGAGIGEALSKELAGRGAYVVVADVDVEAADRVAPSMGWSACPSLCDSKEPISASRSAWSVPDT